MYTHLKKFQHKRTKFFKAPHKIPDRHRKYAVLLVIRDMHNNSTVRCCQRLKRTFIIKKQ